MYVFLCLSIYVFFILLGIPLCLYLFTYVYSLCIHLLLTSYKRYVFKVLYGFISLFRRLQSVEKQRKIDLHLHTSHKQLKLRVLVPQTYTRTCVVQNRPGTNIHMLLSQTCLKISTFPAVDGRHPAPARMYKDLMNNWNKLPTSTGGCRINPPSTT